MNQPTPDLSADDYAALFADPALAAIRASGGAVAVVSETGRVLEANPAALALFGVRDREGLSAKFAGSEPGARRLADLATTLPPGAGARLERLRFFLGPRAETLTLLTRRVATSKGGLLVLASPASSGQKRSAPIEAPPAEPTRPEPAAAAPESRPAPPRMSRFVWQTDAAHCLQAIDPDLAALLGRHAPTPGMRLAELAAACGADPEGQLADALARRGTFASLRLLWPIDGGEEAAPVDFFGVPALDVARRFSGYRGFGVIHPERIRLPLPATAPAQIDAAEPPAVQANEDPSPHMNNVVRLPLPSRNETALEARPDAPAEVPAESSAAPPADAVRERPDIVTRSGAPVRLPSSAPVELTEAERNAFREIARTLGARPASERGRTPSTDDVTAKPGPENQLPLLADIPAPAASSAPASRDILALATPGRPVEPEGCCGGHCGCGATSADEEAQSEALPAEPQSQGAMQAETRPLARTEADAQDALLAEVARNAPDLLDRLPVGVMVSRGSIPIYSNRTLLDLLGYEDIDALHADGGLDRMFRSRPTEAPGETTQGGSMTLGTRDGAAIPVDGRMQTIDWDGDPATLMSFRRAVEGENAWRMRALEMELRGLQNVERELHSILDTATDGVAVIDEQGRILSLNRSAEALFGYEQNEVAGDMFTALLAPSSHRAALDYLDGLKSNGVASVLNDGREVMGRERQGGTIPLFMTMGRVSSSNGGKFCAVLRDMTQWKKAERDLETARREAERASALKSDFLARISHEIRTPLNAILGFAEVIMHERFGPVGNERYKDYLKDIHASGSHVMSLVNDLLDLSKIESGKLELTFAATDVNAIVGECVSLMQAQALQERIILRVALAPRLPQVVADERSLRQIVLNLLSNAVKFNEPGGQVIVSTALTDAGHAVIRVRDTGIGMSDSDIDIALEPFRQLATSRQQGGTGLGLPLTKALVEANRASFTIKSKKAEGTLVEVAFPPTRVLAE